MMKFKGAIFDVDGVIIDTAHIHHLAWQKTFEKYGVNLSYKDFKLKIDGLPRDKGVKKILPKFKTPRVLRVCDEKQRYFLRLLNSEKIKVFKSTVDLIKKLKKKGIKLAMASSSKNAARNLKKVQVYSIFDIDAEGAYVKKGKPFPDLFLKAAKKLKINPGECVVFEDAQAGITAAKRAGMKCIGIQRDKKVRLKGADLVVHDIRKVSIKKIKEIF